MTSEQSTHVNSGSFDAAQANNTLSSAANSFRKSIQEATSNLVSATDQFTAMSAALARSVEDVKVAAAKAHEDRKATEAIQAKFERDYGNLLSLIVDLQERIGALAVLGRPLANPVLVGHGVSEHKDYETEELAVTQESVEADTEWADSQSTANKDPKKWLGWKGWQG